MTLHERHRFALPLALIALALGGCGTDSDTAAPSSESSTDPAGSPSASTRQALAESMATNRVARYAEAWTVLADGARVEPGRIRLFYSRRIIDETDRASGENQSETDFWNREHVWPRSFGIDDTAAETDLHNLVPVDMTINSARSNRFYEEQGQAHRECGGCLIGAGSWAPPTEVRGDAARIAFYMDVRYDGLDDIDVPDLVLGDDPDAAAHRFGRLSTLLRWHCADPVSAEELQRHEAAVAAQGNRNAFVDVPELVGSVYGTACPRP